MRVGIRVRVCVVSSTRAGAGPERGISSQVTELAGEVLRGRGCPRLESSTFPEDSGIIGSDIACSLYVWNRESSDNSCCLCQVWCGCWPIARWRQVSCASRLLLDVGVLLDPGCDVRATTLKGDDPYALKRG